MIKVELRNDNRIITLNSDGKGPILSRNGSFSFYNSLELLCVSLGSCIGNELWKYCYLEKIDISKFEEIFITMNNNDIIVNIKHPKDMNIDILNKIKYIVSNCQVGKLLYNKPICNLITSNKKIEDIIDTSTKKGCCGGG